MNYIYMVPVDGKYVDLTTLPKENQEQIKENLSQRLADAAAVSLARSRTLQMQKKK